MGERKKRLGVMIRLLTGIFLLFLGFIGLFLPILQGVLFLFLGFVLLADHVPCLGRMRDRLYARHPHWERRVRRVRYRWHERRFLRRSRKAINRDSGDNNA